MQARFLGHTRHPYSVAQHSLNCVSAAIEFHAEEDPNTLLALLMHDSAEAYIGDIIRPIKYIFMDAVDAGLYCFRRVNDNFGVIPEETGLKTLSEDCKTDVRECYDQLHVAKNIENNIEIAIYRHFCISHFTPQAAMLLKEIDTRLCATESSILCAESMPPNTKLYPLAPEAFDYYDWQTIKAKFLKTFHSLVQWRSEVDNHGERS